MFLIGFAFGRFEGPVERFPVTSVDDYTGPR